MASPVPPGSLAPAAAPGLLAPTCSTGASAALPLDGTVVKMKGLPFKATPADIKAFFTGFNVLCLYLRRHADGRPNGEAFVHFDSVDEARRATTKDRETFGEKFGDRYVRVYPTLESDASDMAQAVAQHDQPHPQASHGHAHSDSVVKIKSLPFDATQLDIIQFFDTFKLKPNGVQLVVRSDNKPTGEAFVDFETPDEAARSIREKDHKIFSEKFGDRYVRLIQVSRKEMQATLALRFGGEGVLKMKGIPFKATAADVRKFFSSFKIKPDGISFIMHADGRPTGMAFIEFETPQEAVRAMEKDRAKFGPEYGDRFCMLQLVGRHEMDKVTLQRENDNTANKLLNGINVLQAAAFATQAALNNPALQHLMAGAASPWLNPAALYQGLVNPAANPAAAAALAANAQYGQQVVPPVPAAGQVTAGAPAANPIGLAVGVDPAALQQVAAASQYGAQLTAAAAAPSSLVNGNVNAAALNLLQQQQQQGASADAAGNWGVDPAGNPLLFYSAAAAQNPAAAPQDWARAAATAAAADPRSLPLAPPIGLQVGLGAGWPGLYGAAARQPRSVSYPGPAGASIRPAAPTGPAGEPVLEYALANGASGGIKGGPGDLTAAGGAAW